MADFRGSWYCASRSGYQPVWPELSSI